VTQGERRRLQADVRRERALERRLEARVAHTRAELKPLRKVLREQGEHGRLERVEIGELVLDGVNGETTLELVNQLVTQAFALGCPADAPVALAAGQLRVPFRVMPVAECDPPAVP